MRQKKEIATPLRQGDKVVLIWTKKTGKTNKDAEFLSYVEGQHIKKVPLFNCDGEHVSGEDCFWLLEKHKGHVKKYQELLIPLQVEFGNEQAPLKIKEAKKMIENEKKINAALSKFINRHGFNPTDDTWIENSLASSRTEKSWFEFVRTNNMPVISRELIKDFNKANNEAITFDQAMQLTVKRVRYALGAFEVRQKGINDLKLWIDKAKEFEERFRLRDERMNEWKKNKTKTYVTTKKPIEFWAGNALVRCIEKFPQIFTSPDCEYLKSGVTLEVEKFDPLEKWIKLDFTEDVREKIFGQKEPVQPCPYAIVVRPAEIYESLSGVDELL